MLRVSAQCSSLSKGASLTSASAPTLDVCLLATSRRKPPPMKGGWEELCGVTFFLEPN